MTGNLESNASDYTGIQELARQLDVTPRTLRFYEGEGLIEPQRIGKSRVYSRRDVARMHLILRGKRLGFSIREIRDFLNLYDADPQQREQTMRLLDMVQDRISSLEHQQVAIATTLEELRAIESEAARWLGQT